jgi:hypothetical protein
MTKSQNTLIDYAYPMMMAEREMKKAHEALLEGRMDEGLEHLTQAVVEVRLAIHSVKHMKGDK